MNVREISGRQLAPLRYSICTIVTNKLEYEMLMESFATRGFDGDDVEYLFIDNTISNELDAFEGYNRFLLDSRGEYIILCHQDIVLIEDGRAQLDKLLESLSVSNPDWGLCGNAGRTSRGEMVARISHPHEEDAKRGGPFPRRVMSLDENFMIARRSANLAVSGNLAGFHWYGADMGVIAGILGYSTYVVDFHLRHNSKGKTNAAFAMTAADFAAKYSYAFRSRWHHVPLDAAQYLSSSASRASLARLLSWSKRGLRSVPFLESCVSRVKGMLS